jgi:hypothetical protein
MGLFESKEKKAKRLEEEARAKADAEYYAKREAEQQKRKIEKMIAETDKSIEELKAQAASAKANGYAPVYKQCVSFIKVAKTRRAQAEMFLAQINAMQQMKKLADNSKALLGSMNSVMNSLGKLSMDPEVMRGIQRDFDTAQMELDKQSDKIDVFLDGIDTSMVDDSEIDSELFSDADIDSEIDALLANSALSNAGAPGKSDSAQDDTTAYLNKMLNA